MRSRLGITVSSNKGMNLTRSAPATRAAALAGYPQCWANQAGRTRRRSEMDPLSGLVVAVLAFVGSLLGGYTREYFASRGREEGKIDAIQDNLAKVLEQLRETT